LMGIIGDLDDSIGFITWILWSVCLVGIGVLGLTTKEAWTSTIQKRALIDRALFCFHFF